MVDMWTGLLGFQMQVLPVNHIWLVTGEDKLLE